ncbi:MAG: hypothetical protein A2289_18545 [Deltaproteobacteria bacterium RIFOXYA12_FULL_58_15]|nr:MAG: hypothetical protein A2289_18545 [Deltaproteobacteria bacterium RIFOXYA12_FULL_58_15]
MKTATLVLLASAISCSADESRAIRLHHVTRGSCRPTNYDVSCVASIKVQMFGPDQPFRSSCTSLSRDESVDTLRELFQDGERLFVLNDVRARESVQIQMWAYHSLDSTDPCDSLDRSKLIFWGSTDFFDTTSPETADVDIAIDCRPKCDCRSIDEELCGLDLVDGICGPPDALPCEKSCNTDNGDNDCYDGRLTCTPESCTSGTHGDTCCEAAAGDLCSSCNSASACNTGLCVQHRYTAEEANDSFEESFCAETCPPLDGSATPCPSGMGCRRLGGVFDLVE